MPSGEDVTEPDAVSEADVEAETVDSADSDGFTISRNEDGDIVVTLSFEGDRFEGGRLPISALPTLTKMQKLINSVASDVDFDLHEDRVRTSPHAKVELVLTGEIDNGSAKLMALVLPITLAISPAAKVEQHVTLAEAVRRVPHITQQLAASEELDYSTSATTVELVRDLSFGIKQGEKLRIDVTPPSDEATEEVVSVSDENGPGTAVFTHELGEVLRRQRNVTEDASFFVTGTLRSLEDRGDDGSMTLVTGSGQFHVPATAEHRQTAARMYADAVSVIFAVSGRGQVDGAGRMKSVTHLSELTAVDRMFNMDRRLEELRALAQDPDSVALAARIGRASTNLPTIVHHTGLAPGLFLTEDDEIEARWVFGEMVANVTFGSEIDFYIFDQSSEEMVVDKVIDEDREVLPAWAIVEGIQEHRRSVE